jgi:hypothetical protein
MDALLSAIVTWLSINFGLPATYDHPLIVFAPASQISDLRYANVDTENRPEVLAVYDEVKQIIYMADSWTGRSPAELSVLAHEMVHHLQNVSGIKYACPAAREEVAYAAQDRWLNLFGLNLINEFNFDLMALKVSTVCYWP